MDAFNRDEFRRLLDASPELGARIPLEAARRLVTNAGSEPVS